MNTEQILNDILNKALITDRIKGAPNSNKIACFVSEYLKVNRKFNFKKGDYLTYIGGSQTKYLEKGEKYRTTWDSVNGASRIAVIGIDKKRLVMPMRLFTI